MLSEHSWRGISPPPNLAVMVLVGIDNFKSFQTEAARIIQKEATRTMDIQTGRLIQLLIT